MTITAEELAKLDKAATQGEWFSRGSYIRRGARGKACTVTDLRYRNSENDNALICATVNALRSGTLVHVDEVEKLRAALRPFVDAMSCYLPLKDMQLVLLSEDNPKGRRLNHLLPDHFEAARAALGDSQ